MPTTTNNRGTARVTSPEGETTLLFPDDFGLARRLTPLPASSGKTTGRHRLNRGGNRQANNALWRIVIGRLRWHHPTRDYVARRTAEGLSEKEIIRCLKRYVAREVFRAIVAERELARAA
jgi:transposase